MPMPLMGNLLPPQASTFAEAVDPLFAFLTILSVVCLVLITAAAIWFVLRYKRGHTEGAGPSHNTAIELTWSAVPLVIVMAIFLWGFRGWMHMTVPPREAIDVRLVAQKWSWSFTYPNGQSSPELHVPVHTPVRLTMRSNDVLHSFYVRAFRQKMDVLPGRYTNTWFEATQVGEFEVQCTEYCGDGHSRMLAKVVVHEAADYEKWVKSLDADVAVSAATGEKLFLERQCVGCHSKDGSRLVGPSFKGLFGKDEALADGTTVKVDAEYLRESILDPAAKIVQSYPPAMPPYQGQLKPGEVDSLIEYIKTLQ